MAIILNDKNFVACIWKKTRHSYLARLPFSSKGVELKSEDNLLGIKLLPKLSWIYRLSWFFLLEDDIKLSALPLPPPLLECPPPPPTPTIFRRKKFILSFSYFRFLLSSFLNNNKNNFVISSKISRIISHYLLKRKQSSV